MEDQEFKVNLNHIDPRPWLRKRKEPERLTRDRLEVCPSILDRDDQELLSSRRGSKKNEVTSQNGSGKGVMSL